jgi:class 3 adenylate cyclase
MWPVDDGDHVRYAVSGDARLAFQLRGRGPHEIVSVPAWLSNQDFQPAPGAEGLFWDRLHSFATVVSYDARGTGLSDPVSLTDLPTLEGWADDLYAVVNAAELEQATLFATGPAGLVAVLFAATHPERTAAMILVNFGPGTDRSESDDAATERFIQSIEGAWGTGRFLRQLMPDVVFDETQQRDLARLERQSMSPATAAALFRQQYALDVRPVLPSISAPTLVLHTIRNRWVAIEHGRYVAQHIPNARLVEIPGADVVVTTDSAAARVVIDEIEEFVTGSRAVPEHNRMLTTMLFTDVVGSTDRVAAIGDQAWRAVLDRHDNAVHHQLARFSGVQRHHTGDGVLATFDGPARAVRCGSAIRDAARQIGLDVRVGIHTGEVEQRGTDLAGIAVHLAYRVCQAADPAEVLVTRTVVDLVAGSSVRFDDRGDHELKGIPTTWRLFAVIN